VAADSFPVVSVLAYCSSSHSAMVGSQSFHPDDYTHFCYPVQLPGSMPPVYISSLLHLSSLYHRIHAHGSLQLPYCNTVCCIYGLSPWRMASVGLMHNLSKMMVIPYLSWR
jgi:hypothetical protein